MLPCITVHNSYPAYKASRGEAALPKKLYTSLSFAYMRFLMERLRDGEAVRLPGKFGYMQVIGNRDNADMDQEHCRVARADWKRTYEMWARNPAAKEAKQYAILLNAHTNGVIYCYMWFKSSAQFTFSRGYKFKAMRDPKRALCASIRQGMRYEMYGKGRYGLRRGRAGAGDAAPGSEGVAAPGD